jgi:energy-coupling factor transporter ATP-binding protein EcfA2
MSNVTLVIGESGSGKSTAIRNLNPAETFIINVIGKPLPFRGFRKMYVPVNSDASEGNYYESDSFEKIRHIIRDINKKRHDIKTLIIDDFQYTMCNEFMGRATEIGYSKFTEIGQHAWMIVDELKSLDLRIQAYVLSHSEVTNEGIHKAKTIGKMMDNFVTFEGLFTIVLFSMIVDGQFKFQTKADGKYVCKTPMEMFANKYVDNDLAEINKVIDEYYNGDIDMDAKDNEVIHKWIATKESIPEEAIGYGHGHPIQGEVIR